jgi:hypothetical protein
VGLEGNVTTCDSAVKGGGGRPELCVFVPSSSFLDLLPSLSGCDSFQC